MGIKICQYTWLVVLTCLKTVRGVPVIKLKYPQFYYGYSDIKTIN